jgi:CMP-N-acetylneuraminic acid synthetase
MKIAALIPARIGSKRLPKKNILELGGKPLLFWSIETALKAKVFSEVSVSTESPEVIALVREKYSESEVKVVIRPHDLATDSANLNDVCRHYLYTAPGVDFLFLMMPTFPFRRVETISEKILPALYSRQIDRVVSVNLNSISTLDYWVETENGFEGMFKPPSLWCSAGNAAYSIMRCDFFTKAPHQWPAKPGQRTLRIETDAVESLDIDTVNDFRSAEKMVAGKRKRKHSVVLHETDTHEILLPEGVDPDGFWDFLTEKNINPNLPVLILRAPPPYFTFLRIYECSMGENYYTDGTRKIMVSLPASGHSQDFPPHYIHSQHYRVLRKGRDSEGISETTVPSTQVIFPEELKKWDGYKTPWFWEDS